ncbi:hypothetical protein [Micromonospora inyonensis]|uniref:Uncharacterized protein n=1 Tax=Micromonospora inyonensis TaxID=47866 RepID=A0A1C6RDB7_9ACTN|nr:hypothetical protein [Micromonospora inyonensis]SCL15141.1 hypothetical protein GA0074694_1072 [Micromonospora inyonensis]
MTISEFPPDESEASAFVVQRNERDGIFVGRDMHGNIIQHLDDTTKEVLRRLSKEAPALAALLQKALRDGVVSPEVVYALEVAARNINEDVAYMLSDASRKINEDVAWMFLEAAKDLGTAADTGTQGLSQVTSRVETVVASLQEASDGLQKGLGSYRDHEVFDQLDARISEIMAQADRIKGVVSPPPAQIVVNWKPTFWAFLWGLVAGMVLMVVLSQR